MYNEQELTEFLLENPKLTSEFIQRVVKFNNEYTDYDVKNFLEMDNIDADKIEYIDFFTNHLGNINDALDFVMNSGYNSTQFEVIISAINEGVDFNIIKDNLNSDIPYAKLNWYLAGLKDGFERFKDPGIVEIYTTDQLKEIYGAYKDGDDYVIDDPSVPAKVMQLIRHAKCINLDFDFNYGDEDFVLTIPMH